MHAAPQGSDRIARAGAVVSRMREGAVGGAGPYCVSGGHAGKEGIRNCAVARVPSCEGHSNSMHGDAALGRQGTRLDCHEGPFRPGRIGGRDAGAHGTRHPRTPGPPPGGARWPKTPPRGWPPPPHRGIRRRRPRPGMPLWANRPTPQDAAGPQAMPALRAARRPFTPPCTACGSHSAARS